MENPYQPPQATVGEMAVGDNNSGGGKDIVVPPGIAGWSWGAFFWNWIWAIFNKTYIGLLAIVPYVGLVVAIYLGVKGRELAWRNKRWDSLDHFNAVQRKWSWWAGLFFVIALIGIVAAIVIPMFAGPPKAR